MDSDRRRDVAHKQAPERVSLCAIQSVRRSREGENNPEAESVATAPFSVTSRRRCSIDVARWGVGRTFASGVVLAAVGTCVTLFGQPQSDQKVVSFEVASIKPNPSRIGIRGHSFPGDRFEARNVPVRDLIMVAFGAPGRLLPELLMSGGPSWIDEDRFDVTAKVGGLGPATVAQKQLMLRQFLSERLKLVVHTQSVDAPIYALVLGGRDGVPGRQLRRSSDDCDAGDAGSVPTPTRPDQPVRCILYVIPPGLLTTRGQTMSDLAYALTRTLDRVVTDRTGLSGRFDADLQFNPDGLPGWTAPPPGSANRDAPSLFGALEGGLGLKLESTRGAVDVLMIDHIERPTPD